LWRLPLGDAAEPEVVEVVKWSGTTAPPIFAVEIQTVIAGVGVDVPPPIDFTVNRECMGRVTKLKGGRRRWRKNAVLSATPQLLNGVDDGGKLLSDRDFVLPHRKRAVEVSETDSVGIFLPGKSVLSFQAYSAPLPTVALVVSQPSFGSLRPVSQHSSSSAWSVSQDSFQSGSMEMGDDLSDIDTTMDWGAE
jgi:hypothetical protein